MKQSRLISYAVIGFFLYTWLMDKGAQFSAKFRVKAPRLKITRLAPTGAEMQLILPIENSSSTTIPVDDLDVQIYYSNEQIASTKLNRPVSIKAGETTPIYLNLFIPYAGLSVSVVNLIQTGQFETNVLADGTITSAGVTIPFTQTITFI